MASELLLNKNRKSETHYDMESFFYILIYMGIMYEGPHNAQIPFKDMLAFLRFWFECKDMKHLGLTKQGMLFLPEEVFKADILSHFTTYRLLALPHVLLRLCGSSSSMRLLYTSIPLVHSPIETRRNELVWEMACWLRCACE